MLSEELLTDPILIVKMPLMKSCDVYSLDEIKGDRMSMRPLCKQGGAQCNFIVDSNSIKSDLTTGEENNDPILQMSAKVTSLCHAKLYSTTYEDATARMGT